MAQDGRHFAEELDELKQRLLMMGGLAEERVRVAMRAVVERDRDLIHEVIDGDRPLNELHLEIDDRCFKLLALYQPMAVDLRDDRRRPSRSTATSSASATWPSTSRKRPTAISHPPVKALIDLPRMGALAQQMLRQALDAFVSQDIQSAQDVLTQDDVLDALKDQIFRELLTYMLGDPQRSSRRST